MSYQVWKTDPYSLKEFIINTESHASWYMKKYVAIQFLQMRLDSSQSDYELGGRRIDGK